jgi:excisionase family DNA binding protein
MRATPTSESEQFFSIKDIAKRLSVSYGIIRNAINNGKLAAYRVEGSFRISLSDFLEYLESCRYEPEQKPQISNRRLPASTFKHLKVNRNGKKKEGRSS